MSKQLKIECAKCREPATLTDLHCEKCGGRIVKHCPDCGWVLSVLKKYCDSCGVPQEVVSNTPMPRRIRPEKKIPPPEKAEPKKPPKEGKIELTPFEDVVKPKKLPKHLEKGAKNPPKDIPQTIIRKLPSTSPPERKDEKRRSRYRSAAPTDSEAALPRVSPRSEPVTAVRTLVKERPIFSTLLGLALLLGTAALYFTAWKARRTPERLLYKTTGAYLTALKKKNFETAYGMLSAQSRRTLSLERFKGIQETQAWNFDKVKITSKSSDRALLEYELLVSGRLVEKDWLHFVREGSKWRRAYWWHLMPGIEDALERGDTQEAARLADTAAKINPLDPMIPGYLCETAHAQEDFETAEKFCRRSLDMSKIYPSRIGFDGQLHLRRVLADVYRRGLEDAPKALTEYELLLADPLLRGKHKCDVRLASADTYYGLKAFDKATRAFRAAAKDCRNEEEVEYLKSGIRMLTGAGEAEAVAAAQRHRMPGEKRTLLEWRKKTRRDLAIRLKMRILSYGEEETWEPTHVSGSEYDVVVKNARMEILKAGVDLWTQNV